METAKKRGPQMTLVFAQLRNAKPGLKPYKMVDEKGSFLLIQPSGGVLWRFKYRINGHDDDGSAKRIEKKLCLGTYPEVSLKVARERRDEARRLLANDIDPAEQKQRDKRAAMASAANTFCLVAKAYVAKNRQDGLPFAIGLISKNASYFRRSLSCQTSS
ncbi:integrase arm-type DNA-binding domain-containing protein [Asticcacaulis sp. 201]|uniref:integrase arm-type DNA-binding domain-containing protein n=1 Tax=Asticcacaulis sp. 201 TaxID=3028787 RepID=UPI0029163FBF|nr:integrase arm-type DNA-binding domain-containing protein [Asticcacaulis sp. 201]MDV6332351.1 integrase arm-type DNA-binding domain-containing protein [Asticcacaulis sp. 201]